MHSQLTQKKKKLPPEAHTRLTVTQLANPSSRKRNILKSFFNHFPHIKKNPEEDQRFKSLHLPLSCAPYACRAAIPAHLLCANLSSALSKDEKKKNLMKSLPLLFRHDPHLICGMSLRDVEHPELISWAKLTGFLTCRLSEKGKPNPASSHGSLYTQFHSWAAFEAPTPCNRSLLPKLKKKEKKKANFPLLLKGTVRERVSPTYCNSHRFPPSPLVHQL